FGGWNEAVYLTAEVHDARRNMARALVIGIGLIAAIYVLLNLAYLNVLGLARMRESQAVAADVLHALLGDAGATAMILLVAAAALTTMNVTILTGARSAYAFGRDSSLFARLGTWNDRRGTPRRALLLQSTIALLLVGFGAVTREG